MVGAVRLYFDAAARLRARCIQGWGNEKDDVAQWMLREWAQVVIIFKVICFRVEEKYVSTHR